MGVLSQLEAFAKSIITVVGGFGGLVYLVERAYRLIDWFRNRPHLGIRILRETQDAKGLPFVEFEATNLGVAPVAPPSPWRRPIGRARGGRVRAWKSPVSRCSTNLHPTRASG